LDLQYVLYRVVWKFQIPVSLGCLYDVKLEKEKREKEDERV